MVITTRISKRTLYAISDSRIRMYKIYTYMYMYISSTILIRRRERVFYHSALLKQVVIHLLTKLVLALGIGFIVQRLRDGGRQVRTSV